jgi:diguanylate cyclase (GGDEF)-like protein
VGGIIAVSRDITRQHVAEERIKRKARALRKANKRLHAQSRHDALTGLANRRYLFNYVQSEWRRERRHGDPISFIIADIDMFKAYNDRYGHLAGDECLREIAAALRSQLRRPGDLLARYGGEEFAVVLPETRVGGATHLAERMRLAVESLHLTHEGSPVAPYVTVSLGVAEAAPKQQSLEELIERADHALYQAKSAGRNRLYSS